MQRSGLPQHKSGTCGGEEMKEIYVVFFSNTQFKVIESTHPSFLMDRLLSLGQLQLASKQGYTIIIISEGK
jgi:hypothetical protein